jgi:hypothetical protein
MKLLTLVLLFSLPAISINAKDNDQQTNDQQVYMKCFGKGGIKHIVGKTVTCVENDKEINIKIRNDVVYK